MLHRLLLALCLTLLWPSALLAHGTGSIAEQHHEIVQVGPYRVQVGFSEWPMRAERSLDIIFMPDGGIADKKGILTLRAPNGEEESMSFVRHPRDRSLWGLDTTALPQAGDWAFHLLIDGPQGRGESAWRTLHLLERPGPPLWLSWSIGFLPILALLSLITMTWWRVRPGRLAEVHVW